MTYRYCPTFHEAYHLCYYHQVVDILAFDPKHISLAVYFKCDGRLEIVMLFGGSRGRGRFKGCLCMSGAIQPKLERE